MKESILNINEKSNIIDEELSNSIFRLLHLKSTEKDAFAFQILNEISSKLSADESLNVALNPYYRVLITMKADTGATIRLNIPADRIGFTINRNSIKGHCRFEYGDFNVIKEVYRHCSIFIYTYPICNDGDYVAIDNLDFDFLGNVEFDVWRGNIPAHDFNEEIIERSLNLFDIRNRRPEEITQLIGDILTDYKANYDKSAIIMIFKSEGELKDGFMNVFDDLYDELLMYRRGGIIDICVKTFQYISIDHAARLIRLFGNSYIYNNATIFESGHINIKNIWVTIMADDVYRTFRNMVHRSDSMKRIVASIAVKSNSKYWNALLLIVLIHNCTSTFKKDSSHIMLKMLSEAMLENRNFERDTEWQFRTIVDFYDDHNFDSTIDGSAIELGCLTVQMTYTALCHSQRRL